MLDGVMFSNTFNVQNGVRQGVVSSPVLFCIYIDKIIKLLQVIQRLDAKSRVSIWASGYMQMILSCFLLAGNGENFAKATKLKFSTNIRMEKCKNK